MPGRLIKIVTDAPLPETNSECGYAHALIVGISKYVSTRIEDLTASCRSSILFARWLLDRHASAELDDAQLKSLTLILMPYEGKAAEEEGIPEEGELETIDNFLSELPSGFLQTDQEIDGVSDVLSGVMNEWRLLCAQNKNNLAVLYMVGHGISQENPPQQLLLLDRFDAAETACRNPNEEALSFSKTVCAMARMEPENLRNMADRQLFLFDACADFSDVAGTMIVEPPAWLPYHSMTLEQNIRRQTIHSAAPGTKAKMYRGRCSAFCDALLHALDGGAASQAGELDDVYISAEEYQQRACLVTTEHLAHFLQLRLMQHLYCHNKSQLAYNRATNSCDDFVIRTFKSSHVGMGVLIQVVPESLPNGPTDRQTTITLTPDPLDGPVACPMRENPSDPSLRLLKSYDLNGHHSVGANRLVHFPQTRLRLRPMIQEERYVRIDLSDLGQVKVTKKHGFYYLRKKMRIQGQYC